MTSVIHLSIFIDQYFVYFVKIKLSVDDQSSYLHDLVTWWKHYKDIRHEYTVSKAGTE